MKFSNFDEKLERNKMSLSAILVLQPFKDFFNCNDCTFLVDNF